MDVAIHHLRNRLVDEPLRGDEREAREPRRHDRHAEVARAALRARVAVVQMALVDHDDVGRVEPRAELEVAFGEIALEMQGSAGHLAKEIDGGRWQNFALSWPEVVIGGGTPNIQKNIIAERVLGLPKD